MPLSEFLRMASRKTGSGQHKPFPTDLTSRSDHDLVELLWENGQITTQDQSSRARRTSPLNTNKSRAGKFTSGVDSILHDMSPIVVPSPDLDLSQDDDVSPWLDSLTQDYGSVLFPEISDVAPDDNVVSTQNSCLSVDKRDGSLQQSGLGSSKASYTKDRLLCSCPPPPPQHRQASDTLGSGLSGIDSNNHAGNHIRPDVMLGNPAQSRDIGPHTNSSSNYLNFSHFARPANLVKANAPNSVKEKGVVKSAKDSCASENLCLDNPSTQSNATESAAKGVVPCRERVVEHVVASSSVGSGNSGDRVSCEQTHNSKRKYRDIEESEGRSEDVGTESVGVEKTTLAGGKNGGSKRSRAAEVHNLSERKRRDRINEKMRALQELIPNCNKADKASMLDEAIEYLKTLQLQVQIMSMGTGLCMPQMMFPPGMQHMYPAQFQHCSPMGPGGMGMLDINGGCPVFPAPPVHAPQFSASLPANFHRISSPNVPVYGHPFQGFSLTGNSAVGLSGLRSGSQNVGPGTSPVLNSGNVTNMNSQPSNRYTEANQLHATAGALNQSAAVQENKQSTTPTTDAISNAPCQQ